MMLSFKESMFLMFLGMLMCSRMRLKMASHIISVLLWADILVDYAIFVMQNYLTKVRKISFVNATGILNIWGGISMILPGFFLFLVDTLLGNLKMLVISNISYTVGIGLVTMSTPPALAITTGTCEDYDSKCINHTHKVIFYIGMALIAVGVAGNLVSVKPFLDEQHEDNRHDKDGGAREFYKLPVLVIVVIIPIVGVVALPYENPGSLWFGILAICTTVATLLFLNGVFLSGFRAYKTCKPQGSPITSVFRLFFAVVSKIFQPFPQDDGKFYKE